MCGVRRGALTDCITDRRLEKLGPGLCVKSEQVLSVPHNQKTQIPDSHENEWGNKNTNTHKLLLNYQHHTTFFAFRKQVTPGGREREGERERGREIKRGNELVLIWRPSKKRW